MKKPEDTNVLFRILYGDFRTRYTILAPKEAVAAMKKVKRPVTEEKKNIAAKTPILRHPKASNLLPPSLLSQSTASPSK